MIDEEKRLWEGFLWRDFPRWRGKGRPGKHRAKKNRKDVIYRQHYITLYMVHAPAVS